MKELIGTIAAIAVLGYMTVAVACALLQRATTKRRSGE